MKQIFAYILFTLTTLALIGAGVGFAFFVWVSKDLPSITKLQDYQMPLVTTIYARDGSVMGILYKEKRYLVNLDQMPAHTKNAFLAAEDASFYQHGGLNFKAILRAFVANLRAGRIAEGGSTITQQVVKRFLLTSDKKMVRKAKEAILSYDLEKYLTKDDILYLYLNEIFFGNAAYGVEAAAQTYFAKHVEELSIAESAMLAGIPKAPSANNPLGNLTNARHRQLYVLKQMVEKDFITEEQHNAAVAETLVYRSIPDPTWTMGAWYLEEVRRQLIDFFKEETLTQLGLTFSLDERDEKAIREAKTEEEKRKIYAESILYKQGLNIYTAMDPSHQAAAELALRKGLHDACKRRGWRGPASQLKPEEYESFLKESPFSPDMLENAGWVKALVTSVSKDKADVRLGEKYKGTISVKTMGWARTPNPNVSPEAAGQVRDATRVLFAGDVVWVSAVGASGDKNPANVPARPDDKKNPLPAYKAEKIRPETVISLSLEQVPDLEGAVASIEVETGDMVAIAGGYAFSSRSQFNRATQALRQPGSSFKPIVYSAALDHGLTAGSILLDSPFTQAAGPGSKAWSPGNFDGKFLGPIILRTALAKSRNACTVRVAQRVGMAAIIERAKALGIPGNIPPVLAVSLGSYEATPATMAEAYTAFANQGKHIKPRYVASIKNRWMQDLINFTRSETEAITPQNAYIMSSLLKEVVNAGTAGRARVLARPIAGKTGTSNNERDAWFIGFSPNLVSAVYVGYDNNTPMGRMETGGRAALPIFVNYWQNVIAQYPANDFPIPEGITTLRVDPNTGYPAGAGAEGLLLPFISGTEPHGISQDDLGTKDIETDTSEELLRQM